METFCKTCLLVNEDLEKSKQVGIKDYQKKRFFGQ